MVTKNQFENESDISQEERFLRNKQYLKRIHGNLNAVIIKLEDRLQNIHFLFDERIKARPDKAARYVKETSELFIPMTNTEGLVIDYRNLLQKEIARVAGILEV
jgi:(p)ppGpp synthase/HD superfamily hydrolase